MNPVVWLLSGCIRPNRRLDRVEIDKVFLGETGPFGSEIVHRVAPFRYFSMPSMTALA
jgi:hypothetical protein